MPPEDDNADNPAVEKIDDDAGTPVTPDPAQFVPAEDFKRMEATIGGLVERMEHIGQNFTALLASRDAPPASPTDTPAAQMTDEEIEAAVLDGKAGPTFRNMLNTALENNNRQLVRDVIDPIRNQGFAALSTLAQSTLETKPFYSRFKKEIDAYVGTLDPAQRSQPQVLTVAYNAVVGQHAEELLGEAREESLRKATDDIKAADVGGTSGRQTPGESDIPTVEDICGLEAAAALSQRNQTPDQFAVRMGYEDWAAYAKMAVREEEPAGATA